MRVALLRLVAGTAETRAAMPGESVTGAKTTSLQGEERKEETGEKGEW